MVFRFGVRVQLRDLVAVLDGGVWPKYRMSGDLGAHDHFDLVLVQRVDQRDQPSQGVHAVEVQRGNVG